VLHGQLSFYEAFPLGGACEQASKQRARKQVYIQKKHTYVEKCFDFLIEAKENERVKGEKPPSTGKCLCVWPLFVGYLYLNTF